MRDAQIAWSGEVPGDEVYAVGEDAPLQLTIVNTTDAGLDGSDTLVSLSSPIASSGRIVGNATIPDGQVLAAGYDQPVASIVTEGTREVELALLDLTAPVRAGMTYPVVLTFARAGELRLQIGVENPSILPPRADDDA
ncbi:copper chaperone PCu(A)C [Pseudonocardia broussonetiae]|uniref:Copper chaperone PCu(A)C n=1 Tax=Pseudonocardia broussonetiae TaxID=2736640 RepID=A0A6M6JKS3_9PSEU|nr:copper chaperone PCu(A)C [Pseudonocardia broussonetiae]QJY47763.1 copper chaperone PCu(A)C [Pseudonocardia broussonetiae]